EIRRKEPVEWPRTEGRGWPVALYRELLSTLRRHCTDPSHIPIPEATAILTDTPAYAVGYMVNHLVDKGRITLEYRDGSLGLPLPARRKRAGARSTRGRSTSRRRRRARTSYPASCANVRSGSPGVGNSRGVRV